MVIKPDYTSPMAGYTKLWASLIQSTVWREDMHVKVVWITMLALADQHGLVMASVPGLADAARVSVEQCVDALAHLSAPDEWSRTKEHEGRRVEAIDGGWLLLNHSKYRNLQDSEERREKVRLAVQRHRARSVIKCNQGNQSNLVKSQAEAEAEEDVSIPSGSHPGEPGEEASESKRRKGVVYSEPFLKLWKHYPRPVGKGAAYRAWLKAAASLGGEQALLAAVKDPLLRALDSEAWTKDNGQFIPHPATWLNQRRWEDEA